MSKPKSSERPGLVIYLGDQHTQEIDQICAESIAQIPGARLSRSAFATQVVLAELERRRAARQAAGQGTAQEATPAAPVEPAKAPVKKRAG